MMMMMMMMVIIMEICKAPTQQLKALNKHSLSYYNTHKVH